MIRKRLLVAAFAAVLGVMPVAGPAFAVQPDEVLKDPAQEARARALSVELRCLVCQNQSIDDSNAPLARDLRLLVRERITAGDDDREIKAYLVARYGDFVLLKPPFDMRTALLWIGPFLVLAAGAAGVWAAARRRRASAPGLLSDEERRALAELIEREPRA